MAGLVVLSLGTTFTSPKVTSHMPVWQSLKIFRVFSSLKVGIDLAQLETSFENEIGGNNFVRHNLRVLGLVAIKVDP